MVPLDGGLTETSRCELVGEKFEGRLSMVWQAGDEAAEVATGRRSAKGRREYIIARLENVKGNLEISARESSGKQLPTKR